MAKYEDIIRQIFAAQGIDPNTAVNVFSHEGLGSRTWQSRVTKNGVREPSYGPFQFLVGGGNSGFPRGMGNDYMDQTGNDPRVESPENVRAMAQFAANRAKTNGWADWYGARDNGIGRWAGIRGENISGGSGSNAAVGGDRGLTLTTPPPLSILHPEIDPGVAAPATDTISSPTDTVYPSAPAVPTFASMHPNMMGFLDILGKGATAFGKTRTGGGSKSGLQPANIDTHSGEAAAAQLMAELIAKKKALAMPGLTMGS